MYLKDGTLAYDRLPEGFSGGLQHRAVLQQDAYAVDIRCIKVREELIPVFEEVTGHSYTSGSFESMSGADISALSLRFGEEVRKRGYRIMWDPAIVRRI